MRTDKDNLFLDLACRIAEQSYDPKLQVGCIITSEDGIDVYSIGYNGSPHGFSHERNSNDTGKSGFIHAELNAALKARTPRYVHKHVYVTHLPCATCAKHLIQLGGVKKVFFKYYYQDTVSIDILVKAGIQVTHIL